MACNTSGEPAGRRDNARSGTLNIVLLLTLAGTVQSRNCGALPLYPYVQIRCIHFRSRGDPSVNLYLEKISTAPRCGRERASLTVSPHITHSDKEHFVRAHSDEWVSP